MMELELMVKRVMHMTDPEPPPSVIGYAYAGWEENAARQQALFQQSMELQKFDTLRLVAEVCRRLMIPATVADEDFEMLVQAVLVRTGDEDAVQRKEQQVAKTQAEFQAARDRIGAYGAQGGPPGDVEVSVPYEDRDL
jgi:hypothetical protein